MIKKAKEFLKETKKDAKGMRWPSKKEVMKNTLLVTGASLVIALFTSLIGISVEQLLSYLV